MRESMNADRLRLHRVVGVFFSLSVFSLAVNTAALADGTWSPVFERPGLNPEVDHLFVLGDQLVAQGDFWIDGLRESIARWDGNAWHPLGSPGLYTISSAALAGAELYASGYSTSEGDVRHPFFGRWDGVTWRDVQFEGSAWIEAMARFDSGVAIEGYFQSTGGDYWTGIGVGSTDGWSFVSEPENVRIENLIEHDGRLFAFDTAGYDSVRILAMSGDSLTRGTPSLVGAFLDAASGSGRLWVLSERYVEDERKRFLHAWTGGEWIAQDPPSDQLLESIGSVGTGLFCFAHDRRTGAPALYLLAVPGGDWARVDHAIARGGESINDATLWQGDLVLAGDFASIDSVGAQAIAVRHLGAWRPLGEGAGVDGGVDGMLPHADELWINGRFGTVGSKWSPSLARWRNGAWDSPPSPHLRTQGVLFDQGGSVALVDRRRFAIGRQDEPPIPAVSVGDTLGVRWSGSGWQPTRSAERLLSWSVGGTVHLGNRVFAFGGFAEDDSLSTSLVENVGDEWRPIPSPMKGHAAAAAERAGELLLGGEFSMTEPGVWRTGTFAAWESGGWRLLPERLRRTSDQSYAEVEDLARFGDLVLVAGNFDWVGATYSPGIAAWDGRGFIPFASGSASDFRPVALYRLLVVESDVFAAGWFLDPDWQQVEGIFRWDGESWSSCVDAPRASAIRQMMMVEDRLFVAYSSDYGVSPHYFGQWTVPISSLARPRSLDAVASFEPNPVREGVRVRFRGPIERDARWSLLDVSGRRLGGGTLAESGPVPRVLSLSRPELDAMRISSGVYLWSIESGGRSRAARMVVVR